MTDIVTIGEWTVDLDDFDYNTFFVGKETKTVVVDGELQEQDRWIYDHASYYKAVALKQDKDQREHRTRLTEAFTKRGIVTAEVSFSGGNDSGGADDHTFYDAEGNKLDIRTHYHSTNRRLDDGKWHTVDLTDAEKEDNNFLTLIDAPIYWKWGSFAGDFSVSGTMYYDISPDSERPDRVTEEGQVDKGEYCRMEYSESSYEYHETSF